VSETGGEVIRIDHGGREREALVHVPSGQQGELPLVLGFHGGGGHAAGFAQYIGLHRLGDEAGFVVAYPDGTGGFAGRFHTWNAGECCGHAADNDVDDVGFVAALIERLDATVGIDRDRVYATGLSNGAMLTYRLAAELPERLAAIAPVAGIRSPPAGAAGRAVPILHMHSIDDPRALYGGGLGPPFPLTDERIRHEPVRATLAAWARRNGCQAMAPQRQMRRSWRAGDGSKHGAVRLAYRDCPSGAAVVHWRLTGAGHVWPGAPRYRERVLGPPTRVIDANRRLWAFFRGH